MKAVVMVMQVIVRANVQSSSSCTILSHTFSTVCSSATILEHNALLIGPVVFSVCLDCLSVWSGASALHFNWVIPLLEVDRSTANSLCLSLTAFAVQSKHLHIGQLWSISWDANYTAIGGTVAAKEERRAMWTGRSVRTLTLLDFLKRRITREPTPFDWVAFFTIMNSNFNCNRRLRNKRAL